MQIHWNRRIIFLFVNLLSCIVLHAQQQYYVSDIVITGNKTTKESIILRELQLKKGETVAKSRLSHILNRSKENLENLRLFNYTNVSHSVVPNSDSLIVINIQVEERWYYFPLINIKLEDRNTSTWLKDFDISRITFEFGAQLYNMFGINHILSSGVSVGYRQGFNLHYKNITLDRAQKHFLSTGISFQRNHNVDVMTVDDAPFRMKDTDQFLRQSTNWYLDYTYRYNVRISHHLSLGFEQMKIADTLLKANPNYWGSDRTKRMNFSLLYAFRHDQRDYVFFPLKGYYLRTTGALSTTGDLSVKHLQLNANAQYYWDLGNRWYAAERMTAGLSFKNTKSYILDQALGYGENELRGYEYNVIDGQYFAAINSTLRYNILPKKIVVIDWLSSLSKFNKIHFTSYAHAFFDMGYAYHHYPDSSNRLSNQFLYSGGVGIDLVTYYDIVLTLSYSINKQKDHGLHFSFFLRFL